MESLSAREPGLPCGVLRGRQQLQGVAVHALKLCDLEKHTNALGDRSSGVLWHDPMRLEAAVAA